MVDHLLAYVPPSGPRGFKCMPIEMLEMSVQHSVFFETAVMLTHTARLQY